MGQILLTLTCVVRMCDEGSRGALDPIPWDPGDATFEKLEYTLDERTYVLHRESLDRRHFVSCIRANSMCI